MSVFSDLYKSALQQQYSDWQERERRRKEQEALWAMMEQESPMMQGFKQGVTEAQQALTPPGEIAEPGLPAGGYVPAGFAPVKANPEALKEGVKKIGNAINWLPTAGMIGATIKPDEWEAEMAKTLEREGVDQEVLNSALIKLGYPGGAVGKNVANWLITKGILGPVGVAADTIPAVAKLAPVAKAALGSAATGMVKRGVVDPLTTAGDKPTMRDILGEGAFWGAMGGTGTALRDVAPSIPTMIGRPAKTGLSALAGSLAASPITEEKETLGGMALNAGFMALFDAAILALNPMERAMAEGQRKNALIQKKVLKPLNEFSQKLNKELGNIAQGDPSQVVNQLTKTRDDSLNYIEHLARKNKWAADFEQYAKNVVNSSINGTIANYNVQQAAGPSIGQQATQTTAQVPIISKGIQAPVGKTATPPTGLSIPVQASKLGAGGVFPAGQGQTLAKVDEKSTVPKIEGVAGEKTDGLLPKTPAHALAEGKLVPSEAEVTTGEKREPEVVPSTEQRPEKGVKTIPELVIKKYQDKIDNPPKVKDYRMGPFDKTVYFTLEGEAITRGDIEGDHLVIQDGDAIGKAEFDAKNIPQSIQNAYTDMMKDNLGMYKRSRGIAEEMPVSTEKESAAQQAPAAIPPAESKTPSPGEASKTIDTEHGSAIYDLNEGEKYKSKPVEIEKQADTITPSTQTDGQPYHTDKQNREPVFSKPFTHNKVKTISAKIKTGDDWWQKAEITIKQLPGEKTYSLWTPNNEIIAKVSDLKTAKQMVGRIGRRLKEYKEGQTVYAKTRDGSIYVLKKAWGELAGGDLGDIKKRIEVFEASAAEVYNTSPIQTDGQPYHTEKQIEEIIKKAGFRNVEEAQEAFYGSDLPDLRKKTLSSKLAKLPQDKLEQIKFDLQYFAEAKRWKSFTPEEKETAKKLIREMQKVSAKLKYMRPEYRDAIKAVLDEIDLPVISRRKKTVRKLSSLREYVKLVPDNNVPDYLIEKAEILDKKAIRDMTLDELQEVHDTVMGLAKYEELKNILLFKQGKTEFSKVKAQAMGPEEYRYHRPEPGP